MTESVEKSVEIQHNDQNMSELPPFSDNIADQYRKIMNDLQDEMIRELIESSKISDLVALNDEVKPSTLTKEDYEWMQKTYGLNRVNVSEEERERFLKSEGCRFLKSQYGGHMADRERTEK